MLGLFTTSVLGFGSTPAPTTVTGYIADYACWNSGFAMDTGASMTMQADEHTVHCLKMSVCVNSGYLLVTKGEMDAEYTMAVDLSGHCFDDAVAILEPMDDSMTGPKVVATLDEDGSCVHLKVA